MCLDNLKIIQKSYYNLPNLAFLWKVSLKILNSGLTLKLFTHVNAQTEEIKQA